MSKIEVCVLTAIANSSMVITESEGETGGLCLVPKNAKKAVHMKIILKAKIEEIRSFDPV